MNPYLDLPEERFWKKFVASRNFLDIKNIWNPKFPVKPKSKVVTYGSCFAQHIGRALKSNGYNWYVVEKAPEGIRKPIIAKYNYDVFSARTGNIYTTGLLKQWVRWALAEEEPPNEVWKCNGRFVDPFRPRIEEGGFESEKELNSSRAYTIECFKKSLIEADVIVFTLGLTESWLNSECGYEYPMAPGTIAGEFSPSVHEFVNKDYTSVSKDLKDVIAMVRSANPRIKFLLTVSPVPLTATYTKQNVLVATTHSKSILRSVAGSMSKRGYVDYFPSYEIIGSPVYGGIFYEPNKRNVNSNGVNFVMDSFFKCMQSKYGSIRNSLGTKQDHDHDYDVVCEEELLGAFKND